MLGCTQVYPSFLGSYRKTLRPKNRQQVASLISQRCVDTSLFLRLSGGPFHVTVTHAHLSSLACPAEQKSRISGPCGGEVLGGTGFLFIWITLRSVNPIKPYSICFLIKLLILFLQESRIRVMSVYGSVLCQAKLEIIWRHLVQSPKSPTGTLGSKWINEYGNKLFSPRWP